MKESQHLTQTGSRTKHRKANSHISKCASKGKLNDTFDWGPEAPVETAESKRVLGPDRIHLFGKACMRTTCRKVQAYFTLASPCLIVHVCKAGLPISSVKTAEPCASAAKFPIKLSEGLNR